jgi:RNA polymerase sigma factor (sigma-70 family)
VRHQGSVTSDPEQLFDRYGPMVLRRCRALLRNEERAVEATQEVFVKLLEKEVDVRHPSALLFRMATNECLMQLRAGRRRPEDAASDLIDRIATAPDVEGRLDAHWMLGWLFGREPASTRLIATMFLLDGMTWEQIAAELDMSVSGVRGRLRRLRAHLPELEGA